MIKNYFKVAFQNLIRNKVTTFINIAGLAVGMAGVILIFEWAQHEYSYDDFHANKNELYKVWYRSVSKGAVNCWDITPSPMGQALTQNFPEIKDAARIYWPIDRLFNYGDKFIKAKGNDVDKSFLTMFSFPLLSGSAEHALDEPDNIVITEQL